MRRSEARQSNELVVERSCLEARVGVRDNDEVSVSDTLASRWDLCLCLARTTGHYVRCRSMQTKIGDLARSIYMARSKYNTGSYEPCL